MVKSTGEVCDHALHLYTSKINKYVIESYYMPVRSENRKIFFISSESPLTIQNEFKYMDPDLTVFNPNKLGSLYRYLNKNVRIIVDGESFQKDDEKIVKIETYLNNLINKYHVNCYCVYKLEDLSKDIRTWLIQNHSKLQLTTNDVTLISGEYLESIPVSSASISRTVKNNLETIILALLQRRVMCGNDIIRSIHLEFHVLLSPGTVYPILHSLKEKGLLNYIVDGKEKLYSPVKKSEDEVNRIIQEHIQAVKLLNNYLQNDESFKKVAYNIRNDS